MTVIIFLNILVVICSYLAKYDKYRHLLPIGFIVLTFVLGIRYGYGNDYFNYYNLFIESQTNIRANIDIDIGWYVLCKIFGPVGFVGFVFIITSLSQYLIYRYIRNNVNPQWYWLAVFIYLFQPNFMLLGCSMMRQFLVMAMLLNTLSLIAERKILKTVIIVLLAASVHKIAIVFVPFIFLSYWGHLFKNKWFYVVMLFVLIAVWKYSQTILVQLASFMIEGKTDFVSYLYSEDEGRVGIREVFIIVCFVIFMVRNYNKLSVVNQFACILTLASAFMLPFVKILIMLRRVMYIFQLYQLGSFPAVVSNERSKIFKYIFICSVILFTVIDFVRFFYGATYGKFYIEFRTIFQAPVLFT